MTDAPTPATPAIPAGWYPDPSNAAQQRWWDGTQWSEQVSAPYVAAAQQKAPEGTNGNTPWIWLVIVLPVLGLIPLFFFDFTSLLESSVNDPTGAGAIEAQFALMGQPAVWISSVLTWVIAAAVVVFAFLDWRELKKRGVPQPFHWAFAFLAIASLGVVYAIGRGVVTKARLGKSYGITLAAILSIVISVVIVIVWFAMLMTQVFAVVSNTPGLR